MISKSRLFSVFISCLFYIFSLNAADITLVADKWISSDAIYSVVNDLNIDGNYHSMHFTPDINPTLTVGNTYDLNFQNVVLENFQPHLIGLGTGSSVLFDNGTKIQLSQDTAIDSNYTMSFQGVVEIDCFGHEFDISNMPVAFDVLDNSILAISNGRIKGLKNWSDPNMRCFGNDATITLSNCELVLSADYSFTNGSLNLYRDVVVKGPYAFVYQSNGPVTILSNSQWKFDYGTTFKYDSVGGNDRLVMVDETSQLFLNGSTLHVTNVGLQLIDGTLIVDHINTVSCEASVTSLSGALVLGDSSDPNKDLNIEVLPGGSLRIAGGVLDYQNSEV